MKNEITITPLAAIPAYKAASEALTRLAAHRAKLLSEQHTLEAKLRAPVAETVGFAARTAALLRGEPTREDHDALRDQHLVVREAIEAIDSTARLGGVELRSIEAEARAAASKVIAPEHRVLRQRAAELLDGLLAVARDEQALLNRAWDHGYADMALQVRVLPFELLDALEKDSPVQRHIVELRQG